MSRHIQRVLTALARRMSCAKLVDDVPPRVKLQPEAEPVRVPREFITYIRPFGLADRRLPVQAYDVQEARRLAHAAAAKLFPGRSFVVSARAA